MSRTPDTVALTTPWLVVTSWRMVTAATMKSAQGVPPPLALTQRLTAPHIAAKLVKEAHQAIGGKALQPAAGDSRDLGLVKAEDVRGLRLREVARLDDAFDMAFSPPALGQRGGAI